MHAHMCVQHMHKHTLIHTYAHVCTHIHACTHVHMRRTLARTHTHTQMYNKGSFINIDKINHINTYQE